MIKHIIAISKKINIKAIFLLVVILVATFLVVRQFYYAYNNNRKETTGKINNLPVEQLAQSFYKSNIENIRFVIPESWQEINVSSLVVAGGFADTVFATKKSNSACTIAIAKKDTLGYSTRKQMSFGERVFSDWAQFDTNWWVASTTDSAKYSFSYDKRQYVQGEFLVYKNIRNDLHFILFMNDDSSVPDDCNTDFNNLLKTVEPYYEVTGLTSSSDGLLTVEKVWDDVSYNPPKNKSYDHLVFTDNISKEKREVMKTPPDTWMGRFFVSGNKLYTYSNLFHSFDYEKNIERFDSAIYVLDPFTGVTTQILGTAATSSYIHSLYILDGVIYYLKDTNSCIDSSKECTANLHSIPLAGGKPALLAQSSIDGSILGYVKSEKAFYTIGGKGDAGCSITYISKIVGQKEESVSRFEGCAEDDNGSSLAYDKMQNEIKAIRIKVSSPNTPASSIYIKGDILKPGKDSDNDELRDKTFYFDKL